MKEDIEFPSELMIFSDRIDRLWQSELRTLILQNSMEDSIPTMTDWYSNVKILISSQKDIPSSLWALAAKIAWIQADIDFFDVNSDLIKTYKNDPLLLCYLGTGIAEFHDFTKGLEMIKEGYNLLKTDKKDLPALLDIAIPFSLVLNNSDNIDTLKDLYQTIMQSFEGELDSNHIYQPLIIPVQLFASQEDKTISFDINQLLEMSIKAQNHLCIALVHNYIAQLDNKAEFIEHMESSELAFQKINARFRLMIVNTNLAQYYAHKADYEASSKYLTKAFTLMNEISESGSIAPGTHIYPLVLKAGIFLDRGKLQDAQKVYELALERSEAYNAPHFLIKANFGLAKVHFLLENHSISYSYIEKAFSHVKKLQNILSQAITQLAGVNLLTDLNELDDIPAILDNIETVALKDCSRIYYEYVRGKYELSRHNLGLAAEYLEKAMNLSSKCSELQPIILFTRAEEYLHEYKLSGERTILQTAQKMIEDGLNENIDIPTQAKGKLLSAILLSAQDYHESAEEILEELTSSTVEIIPYFRHSAEKMLEDIRDSRVRSSTISPITNFKDVVRYLRDAKTSVESQPR